MTDVERFKHSSRPLQNWPPHVDGYVVLIRLMRDDGFETAYYGRVGESDELCGQLVPHVQELERLLRTGQSFEQAIAAILGPSIRVAIDGDI